MVVHRGAYVAELDQAKLAEGSDDLATDFVGDEELDHAHVRRAEGGILFGSHCDAVEAPELDDWRWRCRSSRS